MIHTVYWIRQEPNVSSVSVMDSMEGAMAFMLDELLVLLGPAGLV